MSQPHSCPQCGTPLARGTLEGLCPACLLLKGMETREGSGPAVPFEPPSLERLRALFPQLEIIELIGRGGMGAVYKARQPSLDRTVALKILGNAADKGNFEQRFNREARALARLNHPNIIGVYEFGEVEGLHFFLMEFVDGVNLRQLQKTSRIAPRDALQIVPQICDALQYAHDEGVVHRDIKPENVLIDRRGRVKIADFGLAKILGIDAELLRLTGEGHVMGTPHYMAPEQLERPLEVDHRADIYSLGVVFYEMLTGELPLGRFAAPSRKVMVDVRLDDVVLRALEKEPGRRYEQAGEIKTDVETIVRNAPESAVRSDSAALGVSAEPRLSKAAVAGAIWAMCLLPALLLYFLNEPEGPAPGAALIALRAVALVLGFIALTSPMGTVACGGLALHKIRHSNGRLYGRRLALFDALLFPLLLMNALVFAVCKALATALVPLQSVADSAYNRAQFTASAAGLIIGVALDVVIVAWLWNRVRNDAPRDLQVEIPRPVDWLRTAALVLVCAIAGIVLLAILATAIGIAVPAYHRAQAATVVHPGAVSAISSLPELTEGKVTIVSIAEHPAIGSKPWSVTGALAGEGQFQNEGSRVYPGPNEKAREIVFQLEDVPEDASMTYKLNPASGWAGGQLQKLPPPSTAYYSLIAASFPKDLARANISVGIALGEWQTIAEQSPNTTEMLSTNKNGRSYSVSFLKPVAQADGTFVLTVSHNAMDQQARVVAVDQADREHTCSQQSGRNGDTFSQFTATFSSVPLEQVKAVRFQVRPYRWKTFEDVPLDPQASVH